MRYVIESLAAAHKAGVMPTEAEWAKANELKIDKFQPKSSDSRPEVVCRVMYDKSGLYLRYQLKDRWVRCVATEYQASVCLDSCVEFFVEPAGGKGYSNFEFNACGVMLAYHVIDCTRSADGFADYHKMDEKTNQQVLRFPSLKPEQVKEEITDPCNWELGIYIPFEVLEREFGANGIPAKGAVWRANFYTCADQTSHPRWAVWSPIVEFNYHQPECFGEIVFG